MGNVLGGTYALTVMTPIARGGEVGLREHLESLPIGPESPLAKLERTHMARWLIMPQLFDQGPPQKPDWLKSQWLVFTSDFDGELDSYLDDICEHMGPEADEIWGHCVGYPGATDRAAFKRYMRHNQIDTTVPFGACPELTVAQVRDVVTLRERLIAFAVEAQDMGPDELYDAYRKSFRQDPATRDLQVQ